MYLIVSLSKTYWSQLNLFEWASAYWCFLSRSVEVCMHVHIYVCKNMHMYVCMHACTNVCMSMSWKKTIFKLNFIICLFSHSFFYPKSSQQREKPFCFIQKIVFQKYLLSMRYILFFLSVRYKRSVQSVA